MKKILVPAVFVATFVLGAFVGSRYTRRPHEQPLIDSIASYEFTGATETFALIRELRAGDTNAAFDSLERDLDSSVLVLHAILHDYPTMEIKYGEHYTNILRTIGEYRSAHPHPGDRAASVAEILSQVKKQN
jgi:hypothetical protein